ncbi:MAG TPA: thiamine-phosphate kinase [Candidatus Binatia bacterium]|nr:thiamine-phosphate kinase [Candidatus Binatia bacterium]
MAASSRKRSAGEHEFLEALRSAASRLGGSSGVVIGIGDDAAVVRTGPRTVLTTDSLIEGVHFHGGWLTPAELGRRAFRVSASDVAAMGGRPRYVLLSLEAPPLAAAGSGFDIAFAMEILRGLAGDARRVGAELVGGNVSAAAQWGVTVTVVGSAPTRPVTRCGARVGDLVLVTGALGGAAAGVRTLAQGSAGARRLPLRREAVTSAYRKPPCRLGLGADLAEARLLRSMIDVSDGLVQDLGHLCRHSDVSISFDSLEVPIHRAATTAVDGARDAALALALGGGEDYELAMTAAPANRNAIERIAARHRCRLTVIGTVTAGSSGVTDVRGMLGGQRGFDHFRAAGKPKGRR